MGVSAYLTQIIRSYAGHQNMMVCPNIRRHTFHVPPKNQFNITLPHMPMFPK